MTGPFRKYSDPVEQLGAEIRELQDRLRALETPRPPLLPVLATDPPETDPINIWLLPDGRLRARHRNVAGTAWIYREWVATAPGTSSSATAPGAAAPAPTTQIPLIADAIWTRSYRQAGNPRTDNGATHLYYGSSGDGFNGRNRSLIGFDWAAIAAALAGSTINKVTLSLTNVHAYNNSGSDIHFGIHNFGSEPGTWAGGGIPRSMISKQHFGKPQRRDVQMPLEFAQAIRDGWGKGIALESPSDSRTYYGYAGGVGSGQPLPRLTVEYAK